MFCRLNTDQTLSYRLYISESLTLDHVRPCNIFLDVLHRMQ